jgi:hypothetical protein
MSDGGAFMHNDASLALEVFDERPSFINNNTSAFALP